MKVELWALVDDSGRIYCTGSTELQVKNTWDMMPYLHSTKFKIIKLREV